MSKNQFTQNLLNNWLIKHLDSKSLISASHEFSKLKTNEDRFNFVLNFKEIVLFIEKTISENELLRKEKNPFVSNQYRIDGISEYKQRNFKNALIAFSNAVVFAQPNSQELLKALSNRSACFFEMNKIEQCKADIQRALSIDCVDEHRRSMLNKRLEKCSFQIQTPADESILDQFCQESIQCEQLGFFNACVAYDEKYGHYVKASRNIEPGEIVLIEKAFSKVVNSGFHQQYCDNCLTHLDYCFEPCPTCTTAVYCDIKCRNDAFKTHHNIECIVLGTHLLDVLTDVQLLALRASFKTEDPSYERIGNLITHSESRQSNDIFFRTCVAAYLHITANLSRWVDKSVSIKIIDHLMSFACNAHEITYFYPPVGQVGKGCLEKITHQSGNGIYADLSMFNHSCNPTVTRNYYKDYVIVRTIRLVLKDEQIFDNYTVI